MAVRSPAEPRWAKRMRFLIHLDTSWYILIYRRKIDANKALVFWLYLQNAWFWGVRFNMFKTLWHSGSFFREAVSIFGIVNLHVNASRNQRDKSEPWKKMKGRRWSWVARPEVKTWGSKSN
jgi:hypothetical protein